LIIPGSQSGKLFIISTKAKFLSLCKSPERRQLIFFFSGFIFIFIFIFTQSIFAEPQGRGHKGLLTPYQGEPEIIVLTEKERQRLKKNGSIIRRHLVGDEKRFATIFRVDASPSTIWSVIKDFSHYPDWIKDIKTTDIYKQENGILYVRFDTESAFIGKNTWFARHDYPVDDREWGTWTLDYDQLSDLDDSIGYWRVSAAEDDPAKSNVTYSAAIKLKAKIPEFIVNIIVKSRLKQATLWVKEQAELR
jgi:hypothetical protein